MTTACLFVWAAVLLTLPIAVVWHLSRSTEQKARYYVHQRGMSQRSAAQLLGVTRYRVAKAVRTTTATA